MARNIQKEVTDRIIEQLRAGVCAWRKPWIDTGFGGMPRNAITGRAYSGINIILLWCAANDRAYSAPLWLTYNQAAEAGGNVKKGEKGTGIVFVSTIEKTDEKTGELVRIPFLKSFTVFNVAQCENLPAHLTPVFVAANADARHELAEEFLTSTGAEIRHSGARAFYTPKGDYINLPHFEAFTAADTYYSTAFHELAHWTGAERRLNRTFGKRFGDRAYSVEELVAELTSAFLCAEFGFDCDGADAAYIDHWVKILSENENIIIAAASAASKAADYCRGLALAEPMAEAA